MFGTVRLFIHMVAVCWAFLLPSVVRLGSLGKKTNTFTIVLIFGALRIAIQTNNNNNSLWS